ncbi:MAG: glycosyltransferase family 2 protein [bacterium]|nr:glycosyltransferase family 2 protein [bacterium]MDO8581582.1 glycosyltransferase family 2 protein [bacterium]
MKRVAVIPAYNEERTIGTVLSELRPFVDAMIVIDDGSRDATAAIAEREGAIVYRHFLNRGLGAALGTGMEVALRQGADVLITFDADGQHRANDIPAIVAPLLRGTADVVIGVRTKNKHAMPVGRRIANTMANVITFFLFGIWTSDSQSGFRAFTSQAARALDLARYHFENMEVSSAILSQVARHKLRFFEVAIEPVYTSYSLSKGQGFREGIRTFVRLIIYRVLH